jgi:cyclic pyranopterin phosphate synthase
MNTPHQFSHLDSNGNAKMVNVGNKPVVFRLAEAQGKIFMQPATIQAIHDQSIPKGDVYSVARIAAIQAAKRTDELIPLCHSLPLDFVAVEFEPLDDAVLITATAQCSAKTGVEMEALTAVSVAALTIYDMCKAVDKTMTIGNISLVRKLKEDQAGA